MQDSLLWSQWCPYYRGFTVQDCLLWSQWGPYYKGFTVHDCLLWSQWCPYYRGSTVGQKTPPFPRQHTRSVVHFHFQNWPVKKILQTS